LGSIQGDQKIWMFINQLVGKQVHLGSADGSVVTLTFANIAACFKDSGVNPGQYMQGKYSFMMFALAAAAMAMIMAAPKGENRKQAFSVIGASAITSFLTGITEPLEFTFLFLAPYMF
jgi:phosphotransferase system  glucose/maltose/N-acetylglucosamine-specific IIC component